MAHGVSSPQPIVAHQTLHGYSEGHRLLTSSIELAGRDAKTMLMMSDASGPAAVIEEDGYLTGYPLPESGYYAFARTWPAPELPRPGCVWTHTILIEFSDIPAVQTSRALLRLFRRPRGSDHSYERVITSAFEDFANGMLISDEETARRILWGIYGNPLKPIVSSRLTQRERDVLALAIWDQQWPRLRRSFRFCTLSFADRGGSGSVFDLQFLPQPELAARSQFRTALNADRTAVVSSEWLDDAISDLSDGPGGGLRQFLKSAGSDVSGRESFAPLATLHALSQNFGSFPVAVERAISLMDETIPESHGRAARVLITRAASAVPANLGFEGVEFVIRHWDLLDPSEAASRSESVGKALWRTNPESVVALLSDTSDRRQIAERALSTLTVPDLVQGATTNPQISQALFEARPDLGTVAAFWSLPGSWNPATLRSVARHPELASSTIGAMIEAPHPMIRDACHAFGHEAVLRTITHLLDGGDADGASKAVTSWLYEAAEVSSVVALFLCNEDIQRASTLEALSRVVEPDFVPNDFGDDPWLLSFRRVQERGYADTIYLPSFLLARAIGRRTRSSADLICAAFDKVDTAAERAMLPDDSWRLLDDRLVRSYSWSSWDRCRRIRHTVVDLFVDRRLDAQSFLTFTSRDEIFAVLVEIASHSYSGRKYLRSVRDRLSHDGSFYSRMRVVDRAV